MPIRGGPSWKAGDPPLAMAGERQEPPVSSHRDQGAMRAATAAAEPPLLPAQHELEHEHKDWVADCLSEWTKTWCLFRRSGAAALAGAKCIILQASSESSQSMKFKFKSTGLGVQCMPYLCNSSQILKS